MDKTTVLVASRHPHLADVRKRVLEQAGYNERPLVNQNRSKTHAEAKK